MTDATKERDAMQRIRIGLTGLAGVLVLVLFAAAVLGLRSGDPIPPAGTGSHGPGARSARASAPKDPLAELGVIPGGADAAPTTPAPAAPPPIAAPSVPAH